LTSPIPDQGATEDQAFTFVLPANTFADVDHLRRLADLRRHEAADGTRCPPG
jgi:hypothetical protein